MSKCTICGHAQREEIDRALVRGESLRVLAKCYGTSHAALFRHKRDHIPAELARVVEAGTLARATALAGEVERLALADDGRALAVMAELESMLRRVKKLFDACDDWLTDPDDPQRYDLGPRAEELLVHYWAAGEQGRRVRAKAPLAELLGRAAGRGGEAGAPAAGEAGGRAGGGSGEIVVEGLELRSADPRELILKTAKRLEAALQLVARLLGQLPGRSEQCGPTVNVLVASPEWLTTRAAILAALEPYPEARAAVAEALRQLARAA